MIPGSGSESRSVVALHVYPIKPGDYHISRNGIPMLRQLQADRHRHSVVAADERVRKRLAGFKEPVHRPVGRGFPEFAAHYVAVAQSQTVLLHYLAAAVDALL